MISERLRKILRFSKSIELVDTEDFDELCRRENEKTHDWGIRKYTPFSYAVHLENVLRLRFVNEDRSIRFNYVLLSEEILRDYYDKNKEIFSKYEDGDYFPFEEVSDVVRKKIREEEWEAHINEISL